MLAVLESEKVQLQNEFSAKVKELFTRTISSSGSYTHSLLLKAQRNQALSHSVHRYLDLGPTKNE